MKKDRSAAKFDNFFDEMYVIGIIDLYVLNMQGKLFHNVDGSQIDEAPRMYKFFDGQKPPGMSHIPKSWTDMYAWARGLPEFRFQCAAYSESQQVWCEEWATKGAHVKFQGVEGCFIIPLCGTHNHKSRDPYMYRCNTTAALKLYFSNREARALGFEL